MKRNRSIARSARTPPFYHVQERKEFAYADHQWEVALYWVAERKKGVRKAEQAPHWYYEARSISYVYPHGALQRIQYGTPIAKARGEEAEVRRQYEAAITNLASNIMARALGV